jgi:hypothetical protein
VLLVLDPILALQLVLSLTGLVLLVPIGTDWHLVPLSTCGTYLYHWYKLVRLVPQGTLLYGTLGN